MAVRKIETELALTGEKAFNDAMKAVNSNLKTLRSDMAAVSAEFDENADSVDALSAKNKILQDSVEQQRVKVDALRQMHEKQVATYGENSAQADKYKQQLNFATVELAKQEKELRRNSAALEAARRSADSAENAAEDLADTADDVAESADEATESLNKMSDASEKAGGLIPKVAEGFGNLATGAAQAGAAVLAVGAGLGVAGVTAMVSFAKEAAEAAKTAEEAGMTLTATDRKWLDFAGHLDNLDASAAKAKRALGGILLPQLRTLSTEGATYLEDLAQSLEEAGDDTEKQAKVISEFMVKGAMLLTENIPEYIDAGKELVGGLTQGLKEAGPILWAEALPIAQGFLQSLRENGPEYVEAAVGMLTNLCSYLASNADMAIAAGGDVLGEIVGGITAALPELGTAAGEVIGSLAAYLLDPDTIDAVVNAAWDLGVALAKCIWNALKETFISISNVPGLVDVLNANMQYQHTGTVGPIAIPGFADGLDRVPYDNYLARLHKDEMVLTAREADTYRRGGGKIRTIETLVIQTQHLDDAEMHRILDEINRMLGGDF